MISEVTTQQVEQYRQQGFLVIENFLTKSELEHWRSVTMEAVSQRLASGSVENNMAILNNQRDPGSFYAQVFTQCLRLADIHPGMAELMFDERLGRVVGSLASVDGIRIWHDQALFKPPYGNITAFHLDDPFWSFYHRDAITLWMALDDSTQANGCLWYLPGSHLQAGFSMMGIGENLGELFKVYPQWKRIDAVAASCPAGSAVFHNGLTAHGAGANMTARPRRAMTCAYMPDGSIFNGQQNVLPDNYFKTLNVGDILNNNEVNRLIWHR